MKKFITVLIILLLSFTTVFAQSEYEILTDSGFEETDDEAWVKYVKAFIDFSEDAHEGKYSLLSSDRTHSTDVVRQYVTKKLDYYGQGKYEATAYVKLAEETESPIKAQLVVGIYSTGGKTWVTSGYKEISTTQWTELSIFKDFTWKGDLNEAEFYIVTDEKTEELTEDDYPDILVDSCSLTPVGFTGEPYSEEAAVPEPTEKPQDKPEADKPEADKPEADKPEETKAPVVTDAPEATEAPSSGGQNENQSKVIGGMIIACGVILLVCAAALFISYRKDKKNENAK